MAQGRKHKWDTWDSCDRPIGPISPIGPIRVITPDGTPSSTRTSTSTTKKPHDHSVRDKSPTTLSGRRLHNRIGTFPNTPPHPLSPSPTALSDTVTSKSLSCRPARNLVSQKVELCR